jgi:hypothetical protein
MLDWKWLTKKYKRYDLIQMIKFTNSLGEQGYIQSGYPEKMINLIKLCKMIIQIFPAA